MRQNAIVPSHYSQHALLGLSLSGRVSNPLPCLAWWCFARRGANLSSKQMKNGFRGDCRYKVLWIRAHISPVYLHAQSRGKKHIFHFLLIAALPDTDPHVVGLAIGCCIPGKVMRHYWRTQTQNNTQTHQRTHTRLEIHCLKAECWFTNELSWWQILPFNWLVKEAIRIQCIDAHQRGRGRVLGFPYIMCECLLQNETHIGRPQPCHSLL